MANDNNSVFERVGRMTPNTTPYPPAFSWTPLNGNNGGELLTSTNRPRPHLIAGPPRSIDERLLQDPVRPSRRSRNLANEVMATFGPHMDTITRLTSQAPATQQEAIDEDMQDGQVAAKANINVAPVDFSRADKKLLDFGMHSDAKVIANGKVHEVHKSVLCTRSKWFRAAYVSGFKEGNTSVVNISAPDNIDLLLEFLYTGAVNLSACEDAQVMAVANELAALGDFYKVDKLKTYAQRVLGQYLGTHLGAISGVGGDSACLPRQYWNSPTLPLPIEKSWNYCPENYKLMKEAGFVDRLCAAIRDAYATPSGIHRVYVAFVCAARAHTFKCQVIRDFRQEVPEFAEDLLTAMMDGLECAAFEGNAAFEKWKDTLSVEPSETYCAGCAQPGRNRYRVYD